MDEKEIATMIMTGRNGDGSLDGSHHLIVELMKGIAGLDADNHIIESFELKVEFSTEQIRVTRTELEQIATTEDGSEVFIDLSQLDRMNNFRDVKDKNLQELLRYINSYSTGENHRWMKTDEYIEFLNKLLELMCKVWKRKLICALCDVLESSILSDTNVSYRDINDIFEIFDIPYKIRKVNGNYIIDRI